MSRKVKVAFVQMHRTRSWRQKPLLSALSSLVFVTACGGGGPSAQEPEGAWASSHGAQEAFRRIHGRWAAAAGDERLELEQEFAEFIRRYGSDPESRVARVYLAWIYVQRGRLDEARRLSKQLRREYPGPVGDFATVVEGAVLVRENKAAHALALLEGLRGKLIDPDELVLFGGEIVRAALAAKQYEAAASYMVDWLEEAQGLDRDMVQAEVNRYLRDAPPPLLEAGIRVLETEAAIENTEARSPRAAPREWLLKALRARLVRVALSERDVELARRLLDSTPPSFRRDPTSDALARLASEGRIDPRIAGRALGVALRLSDPASRKRSVQIVAGISRALGLPAAAADPGAVRLIAREALEGEGNVGEALSGLAGEGAAILVAGVTRQGAVEASQFAEQAAIPVIVMADPGELPRSASFTFVLGTKDEDAAEAHYRSLIGDRAGDVEVVGAGGVACDAEAPAGQPRFPVREWKRRDIDTLLLLGDSECTRDVIAECGTAGVAPLFVFGLGSAELYSTYERRRVLVATSGPFPAGLSADVPGDMRAWSARGGGPPRFYEALGHDAGVLAEGVLKTLPLQQVDIADEVAGVHRKARERLVKATAALWTTEARGFAPDRRMPRNVRLVAPPGAQK